MVASRRFHALPIETKRAITVNHAPRGFLELASSVDRTSSIQQAQQPNHSESFIKLHDVTNADLLAMTGQPLCGPNQWLTEISGFRESVETYEGHMEALARHLVQAMAVAFGLPETGLDRWLSIRHHGCHEHRRCRPNLERRPMAINTAPCLQPGRH